MNTYVITGATGHTGKPIATGLLEKGQKVRIISRDAGKSADLIAKGAEHFVGSTDDVELLKRAFDGADAAYLMIPFDMGTPNYTAMQLTHVNAMAAALKGSSIKYIVTLSSVGAHLEEGAGVVQGLEKMEKIFNAISGINIRHLRASYFMENTLAQVGTIKFMGVMATPVLGDLKIPMVATADIAAVGLKRLLELNFSGSTFEYVLGPNDVSYNEIASLFGSAIGMPELKYVAVPYEDAVNAMMGMGMGASVSQKLVEFVKAMNEGKVLSGNIRTPENTTTTTIEEFTQVFRMVFEG